MKNYMRNLIQDIDIKILTWLSSKRQVSSLEALLRCEIERSEYWRKNAVRWHREFEKFYNLLQQERKGK